MWGRMYGLVVMKEESHKGFGIKSVTSRLVALLHVYITERLICKYRTVECINTVNVVVL